MSISKFMERVSMAPQVLLKKQKCERKAAGKD